VTQLKLVILGLSAALAPFLSAAASAQSVAMGDATRGKQVYLRDGCDNCHGTTGAGGRAGPPLAHDGLSPEAMLQQIRSPAAQMPLYTAKVLPDGDAADVIAFVQSLSAGPAPSAADIPMLNR
jgi:mono/diheme cytochrome c family protein